MKMAISRLQIFTNYVLIDSMSPDFLDVPGEGILDGDNKSLSNNITWFYRKSFKIKKCQQIRE